MEGKRSSRSPDVNKDGFYGSLETLCINLWWRTKPGSNHWWGAGEISRARRCEQTGAGNRYCWRGETVSESKNSRQRNVIYTNGTGIPQSGIWGSAVRLKTQGRPWWRTVPGKSSVYIHHLFTQTSKRRSLSLVTKGKLPSSRGEKQR